MLNFWTNEDIEAILVQLNNMGLPFGKYEFSRLGTGLTLLGSGACANVYEAVSRNRKKTAAIKVIGFGGGRMDPDSFRDSVRIQTQLAMEEDSIVMILDSAEIRVWIENEHDVIKAERVDPYFDEAESDDEYLYLQFLLMEKLSPVLETDGVRRRLFPHKLASFDEQEVLKLAYDIGLCIDKAHKKNVLHRDIKLENIFYDAFNDRYKLGDFGIAVSTCDGMADTVAFTKGYGAPEVVGTLEDRYDQTADIYSFGMVLYVLLNELSFPGSANYHPNVYQYVKGYVPPEPVRGSDELSGIVLKMISFDPDDRYQSMEEVLNAIDALKYSYRLKYQREHRNAPLVIGSVFALMGSVIWKMSFMQELELRFPIWLYIILGAVIIMSVASAYKHSSSGSLSGIGLGIIASSVLTANITYLVISAGAIDISKYSDFKWMAVLLISLGLMLLFLSYLRGERDEQITKMYLGGNRYIIVMALHYVILILFGVIMIYEEGGAGPLSLAIGKDGIERIVSWNPLLVGICGSGFWILWTIREKTLSLVERYM
ncbi:Serine/threonine protein kinase [Lachnospiraceae bacterium XBB2008]|nr:Serine/threonine protein kinase [Lachnospiraceae bacterium XBB2008]